MIPACVVVRRFDGGRYTKCASCNSVACWSVAIEGEPIGTTTCDRHLPLWERRTAERAEAVASR